MNDPRPLSSFPPKEREILKQFQPSEKGTDSTFEKLPNRVQEIGLNHINNSTTKQQLIQKLDTCGELRELLGTPDGEYIREVDAIVRYYEFKENK
jgi:hypothetical protein